MPQRKPELSAAEWELMRVVWNVGKALTVREVLEQAYPNSEKAYTTVQTFMNILVDKGFLKRKKIGLVNFYSATVSRENVLRRSLSVLAKRMFQGSFGTMASFLISSAELSEEEIDALKKLLDQHSQRRS